jgi:large subunit ribosomal protein L1
VSFETAALRENLEILIADLIKAKPSTAKGVYLKKITVSTTMGPGIAVDRTAFA